MALTVFRFMWINIGPLYLQCSYFYLLSPTSSLQYGTQPITPKNVTRHNYLSRMVYAQLYAAHYKRLNL